MAAGGVLVLGEGDGEGVGSRWAERETLARDTGACRVAACRAAARGESVTRASDADYCGLLRRLRPLGH